MKFDPASILSQFAELSECQTFVVAYSGGLDSTVLLHAVTKLRDNGDLRQQVKALHVNHGLNSAAGDWQDVCARICQRLGVELQCVSVTIEQAPGRSLEELARESRYQVFSEQLKNRDCLLMAHHQDDEIENLLLRLTRGSGPAGLKGILRTRTLGEATLLRPLLGVRRDTLHHYAKDQQLEWIEDDSNADIGFDRNFWRHQILPLVEDRFPGYRESWSKSMSLIGEADSLTKDLAAADLSIIATDDARVLEIEPLLAFSEPRQRNALRFWMAGLGFQPPGWQLMQRLTNEILASDKSGARLDCKHGSVQRFGNKLVLLAADAEFENGKQVQSWRPASNPVLELQNNGELRAMFSEKAQRGSERFRLKGELKELVVGFRQQGEHCRLAGRPTKSIKKILQESTLPPPWLRSRQPLVYSGDSLVCVPGIGVCEGYLAEPDQPGMEINWEMPDQLFKPD